MVRALQRAGLAVLLVLAAVSAAVGQEVPPADRWWVAAPGIYFQGTHETDGAVGVLTLPDGRRIAIAGRWVETSADAVPPAPYVEALSITGAIGPGETGEVLVSYVYRHPAGGEGATHVRFLLDGQVVAEGPPGTAWIRAEGDAGCLDVEVLPVSAQGVAGSPITVQACLTAPPAPPPDPDPPGNLPPEAPWPEPLWRIAPQWGDIGARGHPRGPGPVNGPHPEAGPYLSVLTPGKLGAHLAAAAGWNPMGATTQTLAWSTTDLVVAWLHARDPDALVKANAFLARFGGPSPPTQVWAWLAAAVIADHFWHDLDPAILATAREVIRAQLDVHRNRATGTGWKQLDWEEWTQSSGAHGYVWALLVFADTTPQWQPLLEWFGHVWFHRYAPLNWAKTVGPDGASHPNQTYLAANTGAYLYHLHLCMSVALGIDCFTVPENGGYYGPMLEMAWQRRLPSGQDLSWGCQANSFYTPVNWKHLPGFPHAHALAYQIADPVGMSKAWSDGPDFRDPLRIISRPWSAFAPTTPPPAVTPETEWRCATFGVARSGWDENAFVVSWARGKYQLGHHRRLDNGELVIADGGCWLVGRPTHYGFGWQAEFYHRLNAYNGVRIDGPEDQSDADSYPFYLSVDEANAGILHNLTFFADGGPNRRGLNPYDYRPAQTTSHLQDPWADFNSRRHAFERARPLGWGPGWESIDWTPGWRAWSSADDIVFRRHAADRGNRAERWVRALAWGDKWVIVYDDVRPEPGGVASFDLHLHGIPVLEASGAWHLDRTGELVNAQGGWEHVAPPGTRRLSSSRLRIDGQLWIRQLAGGGTVEVGPTPTAGIRQLLYGTTGDLTDTRGPDDWAQTRYRLDGFSGPLLHVLSTGPAEAPSIATTTAAEFIVVVAGTTVRIDRATYQVTRE